MSKVVGERIRSIRLELGETLEVFGKRFNPIANKTLVSAWESGRYVPNIKRLKVISELANMTVEELLDTYCEVCAGNDFQASWYPESQLELSPWFNVTEDKKIIVSLNDLNSNFLGFIDIDINYCPECGRRLTE